jgi:hypothetical protein
MEHPKPEDVTSSDPGAAQPSTQLVARSEPHVILMPASMKQWGDLIKRAPADDGHTVLSIVHPLLPLMSPSMCEAKLRPRLKFSYGERIWSATPWAADVSKQSCLVIEELTFDVPRDCPGLTLNFVGVAAKVEPVFGDTQCVGSVVITSERPSGITVASGTLTLSEAVPDLSQRGTHMVSDRLVVRIKNRFQCGISTVTCTSDPTRPPRTVFMHGSFATTNLSVTCANCEVVFNGTTSVCSVVVSALRGGVQFAELDTPILTLAVAKSAVLVHKGDIKYLAGWTESSAVTVPHVENPGTVLLGDNADDSVYALREVVEAPGATRTPKYILFRGDTAAPDFSAPSCVYTLFRGDPAPPDFSGPSETDETEHL